MLIEYHKITYLSLEYAKVRVTTAIDQVAVDSGFLHETAEAFHGKGGEAAESAFASSSTCLCIRQFGGRSLHVRHAKAKQRDDEEEECLGDEHDNLAFRAE